MRYWRQQILGDPVNGEPMIELRHAGAQIAVIEPSMSSRTSRSTSS